MLTSITGFSQVKINNGSYTISSSDLRITNQIFIEHKNQKVLISEQKNQINLLNKQIDLMKDKDLTKDKILAAKDAEIDNLNQTTDLRVKMLNEDLKKQTRYKTAYKATTIGLIVAILGTSLYVISNN
jgi:hypothetical protein